MSETLPRQPSESAKYDSINRGSETLRRQPGERQPHAREGEASGGDLPALFISALADAARPVLFIAIRSQYPRTFKIPRYRFPFFIHISFDSVLLIIAIVVKLKYLSCLYVPSVPRLVISLISLSLP